MNYSVSQKAKLMKKFDKTAALIEDYVIKKYGNDFAGEIYSQTRQEYEKIIPEIPHVKGIRGSMLNSFLIISAQELAVYRAMKKHNKSPAQAWGICHEAIRLRMGKFSKIKRRLMKCFMFSAILQRIVKRRAHKNITLKVGDFEIRYVLGNGREFDWGVDYLQCGIYNFMKAQNSEEFAPFVCMSDIALSDALGWGLIRTQTIADGCRTCNFRFKKAGQTKISSKTP